MRQAPAVVGSPGLSSVPFFPLFVLLHAHGSAKNYLSLSLSFSLFPPPPFSFLSLLQPSFEQRRSAIEDLLHSTHAQWMNGDEKALELLVNKSFFTIDVLLSLLYHEEMSIRLCALNLYIRRAYQTLSLQDVQLLDDMVSTPSSQSPPLFLFSKNPAPS